MFHAGSARSGEFRLLNRHRNEAGAIWNNGYLHQVLRPYLSGRAEECEHTCVSKWHVRMTMTLGPKLTIRLQDWKIFT